MSKEPPATIDVDENDNNGPEYGQDDEPAYPDGGWEAIIVLFGCFCAFFSALSMLNSIGAYQAWISQHQLQHVSSGKVAWIFGFHSFFSFFAGLFFGPLFDAKGPRPLSLLGTCAMAITYLTLGQCKAYWEFFLCIGVMGGLSTSLMFTSAMSTVQHWFLRRRGLATGIAVSGGSVGGIVFPIILGSLLPKLGFAWGTRIIAFALIPIALLSTLLMRARFSKPIASWIVVVPDLTPLRKLSNLVLAIGLFFTEMGIFIPVGFLASYGLRQGFSQSDAYQLLTFLNVGSLLGRWLPGYLGDKLGRFNAFICALVLCLISVLALWLTATDNKAQLRAFAVVFGLGSGSGISLAPACLAQMCDITDYGRFFTIFYTTASFGYVFHISFFVFTDFQY